MNERIDHAAEARRLLADVAPFQSQHLEVDMQSAATHATLAVAEQLRIANLIAVAASESMDVSRKWYPAMPLAYEHVRQEIAAALGIEVESDE